jgi:hypothetical protein
VCPIGPVRNAVLFAQALRLDGFAGGADDVTAAGINRETMEVCALGSRRAGVGVGPTGYTGPILRAE